MSSIFGFQPNAGGGNYVTLDTEQDVSGLKRLRNDDNELHGTLIQPTIEAEDAIIDPLEISYLEGASGNLQDQIDGLPALSDTNVWTGSNTFSGVTVFTGEAAFVDELSAPHCAIVPINGNDLCNKAYVDSVMAASKYELFLNSSQSFGSNSLLSTTQVIANQIVNTSIAHSTTGTIRIFENSFSALGISKVIPAGVWQITLYANVSAQADVGHFAFNFSLIATTNIGGQVQIAESAYTPFVYALSPAVGSYTTSITILSGNYTAYDNLRVSIAAINTRNSGTSIINNYFQYPNYYAYMLTSYSVLTPDSITTTANTWTAINQFTAQGSTFPITLDSTVQDSYFIFSNTGTGASTLRSSTNARYRTSDNTALINITGNAGAISLTASDELNQNYFIPFSKTSAATSNILYIDNSATTLFYNPSVGRLTTTRLRANRFSIGGEAESTENASYINQSTSSLILENKATSGSFQVNLADATNTVSTPLTASSSEVGISADLAISSVNPLLKSTNATNDLRIQTPAGRAIVFNPNNAAAASTIRFESDGAVTVPVSIRSLNSGGTGITILNQSGNVGGIAIRNENTTASIVVNTLGTGAKVQLQVNSVNQITAGLNGSSLNVNGVAQVFVDTVGTYIRYSGVNQVLTTGAATVFYNQIILTPGPTIASSGALALPLQNLYFISATGAITITLPITSSGYVGTVLTFRRTVSGGIITVNQSDAGIVMVAAGSVAAAASVSIAIATTSFQFASNGTRWLQLY
jgi:hypothetical protein